MRLKPNRHPGIFIAVCGTDGAGKTTLIQGLAENLHQRGHSVVLTKQPTDAARSQPLFYDYIYKPESRDKADYRALLAFMLSDRLQHQKEIIEPALKAGKTVVTDRYIFTMLATMWARGFDEKWLIDACEHFVRPDCTFVAMADISTAVARIKTRSSFEDSFVEYDHLEKSINGFARCVEGYDLFPIDTHSLSSDEVSKVALSEVERTLSTKAGEYG